MESYRSADDLRDLGIFLLTGEACGIGMRVLCDLNDEGIRIWESFTRSNVVIGSNWNSKGKASVMIPRSMFRELWIFGQLMRGMRYVFDGGYAFRKDWTETRYPIAEWITSERSGGMVYDEDHEYVIKHPVKSWQSTSMATNDDDEFNRLKEAAEEGYFYFERTYARSTQPGTGLDNTHAMSGRTL